MKKGEWGHTFAGEKFGRLTVLYDFYNDKVNKDHHYCHCICDCENKTEVDTKAIYLKSGKTKSCGCYSKEHPAHQIHGMSNTRFFKIWMSMKYRCYNRNSEDYKNYGGRGIKVCDRWLELFTNFKEDMYESYLAHVDKYGEKDTSIDRIDADGNYCKENCRWATQETQQNNRRNNHLVEYNNEVHTLAEWGKLFNISSLTILDRLIRNWDVESAITTPVQNNKEKV